ncbi:NAD(P)-dependent oxidoreductase [Dyadobacter sandarakinus]|uniref:NAD(P)H-binding protein n=1 Tax=Dyadobacter sandarakinus TaxID=2747268 RepID=A0ABX7I2V8_9BACT|nr:NAD(P)H-binding protein [Dyadobacter sandarakinus]QRR00421.1 NAD(P)H-binding protein [Dyadobacter sandarakinus]
MKVAVIGATGFVGMHLVQELISRDHKVIAIARNPQKAGGPGVETKVADVNDPDELAAAVAGADAVVSTFNAGWSNPNLYEDFLDGSQAIQEGVRRSGVRRFLFVGGAGSLEIAPGIQLVDTPQFPAEYKSGATAARDYLNILKEETELEWTFLSPAIEMHPGTSGVRKGTYRTSLDTPVFDEHKRSVISAEDLAVAIVDEIEQGNHIRERFTVAY